MFSIVCKTIFIVQHQGQATDIQIQATEIQNLKKQLTEIYVKHTKQTYDCLYEKMERDNFLSPEAAKQLGLIDEVLEHPPASSDLDEVEKST